MSSATYIQLSKAKIRQDVEVTQVGFDVENAREAWESVDGVTHYDALTVVCNADDADSVEASLRGAGYEPTNRRPVYAVGGPEGDVIHRVHCDVHCDE